MPSIRDLIAGLGAAVRSPSRPSLGYSPDILEDYAQAHGGPQELLAPVLAARYGETSAPQDLAALSPEDRAALDRYSNFARLSSSSSNPASLAANYLGGMGAMAVTEGLKLAEPVQEVASDVWNRLRGTPDAAPFFGGADTSKPNLGNIIAAHHGFVRGMK